MGLLSIYDIKNLLKPKRNIVSPSDDFRIINSWVEYGENKKNVEERPLNYMCYEMEVINPDTGDTSHFYKAVKFARIMRIPKSAKQSTALMDMHQQILSSIYENEVNLITIIANIINPVPLGLLFLYGVQGVAENIEDAKEKTDNDFIGLIGALQGTYRVLEIRNTIAQEIEWLREKIFGMEYITAVRGIPKAAKSGEDAGNTGIGGKNLNPDSEGTLEELIAGMADYEYIMEAISTPVPRYVLERYQTQTEGFMTDWYGQLQGQKNISFNVSIPMMYGSNASSSQGTSHAYTEADSVNYSTGENFSTSFGTSVGESLSNTFGTSIGHTEGSSVSDSISNSVSESHGTSIGQSIGESIGNNTSFGTSSNESSSFGTSSNESSSFGESTNASTSYGTSTNANTSYGTSSNKGVSQGTTIGQSLTTSQGNNTSTSFGQSQGISSNQSHSVNNTTGTSENNTYNISNGQTEGTSHNLGTSENYSYNTSHNVTEGTNSSVSNGTSSSHGQTIGSSNGVSNSTSLSQSQSSSSSNSENTSLGINNASSVSKTDGISKNDGSSNGVNAGVFGIGGSHSWNSSDGSSWSVGTSESSGLNFGNSAGYTTGNTTGNSSSESTGQTFTESNSVNSSVSQNNSTSNGISHSTSNGWGESNSAGSSESFGTSSSKTLSESFGTSMGTSNSVSIGDSTSNGWNQSASTSQSSGTSSSISQGQNVSSNTGTNSSIGTSSSVSQGSGTSSSVSQGSGTSSSISQGNGISSSMSHGNGSSESFGQSFSKNTSQNISQSNSISTGRTIGKSVGYTQSDSYSQSQSVSKGENTSKSESNSSGTSYSTSSGKSISQSAGTSSTVSTGMSSSMGLGPSMGYSKSYQWLDQTVKDILEALEYDNNRWKRALRGEGAFYTYLYIACPSADALSCATMAAKSAWQNEEAMTHPLQILNLNEDEQKHLLYHFSAFSSDITKEDVYGKEDYRYCTILLPYEYIAYTHLPRISEGGIFAEVNDIPKFSVPGMMKGEIYMGTVLSPERWTFKNGYSTQFDYRIDESELMHGFFTGASRSGKTVAAMRFVAELSQIRRKKTGKRLRIVCLDPKRDWRGLARYIEPERFNFYSMGNLNFRPLKLNPWKIPYGVWPQSWIDGVIDIYCRAYGLLERGKQMMGEIIYKLYDEAGVFEACNSPDWKDKVPALSKQVTFEQIYKKMDEKRRELSDSSCRTKVGHDTMDAYARLLDRLQAFDRSYSIEHQLFGTDEGIGIDELIGEDDVTVLESKGLENTFKNFIFGVITSGFYKFALGYEKGYLSEDQYETVLVIEEANEILTGNDCAGTGGSRDIGMSGQSEFEQILDQSAGYGLFIIAITQRISLMPASILANAGLKFIGKINVAEDVNVAVRQIGREERIEDRDVVKWLPKSPTGWFIAYSSRGTDYKKIEPVLVNIAMLNLSAPTNSEIDEILTHKDALATIKKLEIQTA